MNNSVGSFPIRQDVTVLPPDDPKKTRLGWVVREEVGIVAANDWNVSKISFYDDDVYKMGIDELEDYKNEEDNDGRTTFAKMVFDIFDKSPMEILFGEEHKCEETTERGHIHSYTVLAGVVIHTVLAGVVILCALAIILPIIIVYLVFGVAAYVIVLLSLALLSALTED